MKNISINLYHYTAVILLTMFCLANHVIAANYGVSPLSITFDGKHKSQVITVKNDDSKAVSLRIDAKAWTQDESGSDRYEKTTDLVFFPKRLNLEPGEKRIVRVGVRNTEIAQEKAYRLYIEELPPAATEGDGSTKLAVLVTFGLPVFIRPQGAEASLTLVDSSIDGNNISLRLKNSGRRHGKLSSLVTEAGKVVSENLPGCYLLPSTSRQVNIVLPASACDGQPQKLLLETEPALIDTGLELPARCDG